MASLSSKAPIINLVEQPLHIYQNDFTPSTGNSLQACIASIFGQTLKDVPNFITLECGYLQGIQNYVNRFGYHAYKKKCCSSMDNTACERNDVGKICVIRGKSPRGDFGHVVVGKVGESGSIEEWIHDPHPDSTFLDKSESFGWYMIFEVKDGLISN
jgi:hypothetical protein